MINENYIEDLDKVYSFVYEIWSEPDPDDYNIEDYNSEEEMKRDMIESYEFILNTYDYYGDSIEKNVQLTYSDVCDIFSEELANEMVNRRGRSCGGDSFELEVGQDTTPKSTSLKDVDDVARRLMPTGEYFKGCRGFILDDGTIVYTEAEHNMCTVVDGIKSTFDFIHIGNIRILDRAIDLSLEPTPQQRRVLMQVINSYSDGELYLDIITQNNGEIGCVYHNADYKYVLGEIDRYFNEGIKPMGNDLYESKIHNALIKAMAKYTRGEISSIDANNAIKKFENSTPNKNKKKLKENYNMEPYDFNTDDEERSEFRTGKKLNKFKVEAIKNTPAFRDKDGKFHDKVVTHISEEFNNLDAARKYAEELRDTYGVYYVQIKKFFDTLCGEDWEYITEKKKNIKKMLIKESQLRKIIKDIIREEYSSMGGMTSDTDLNNFFNFIGKYDINSETFSLDLFVDLLRKISNAMSKEQWSEIWHWVKNLYTFMSRNDKNNVEFSYNHIIDLAKSALKDKSKFL